MIYDITQEIFSGKVYPGDMAPEYRMVYSMANGAPTNASEIAMNTHNATHIDAPFHRIKDGKAIDALSLDACIGECEVISYNNKEGILNTTAKRVLLRDCERIDADTARLFVQKGVLFVGVEGQSVGSMEVHNILLEADIVVLEGAVLSEISEGKYFLFSAPIKLGGLDGAPCRSVLIDL